LLAAALVTLTLSAPASASKEVINLFGASGSFGGELENPRDLAVNPTGVGAPKGTIYVADDSNNRIERFDKSGKFVSAWGMDVISPTLNERQQIVVDASAGSYTLTFNGSSTAPIAYNAIASGIRSALAALPSVGGEANVAVSGTSFSSEVNPDHPFTVTFQGPLAAADQPQITANTSQLTGTLSIATLADGTATTSDTGTGFEVCAVALECKAGVASGGDGTTAGDGSLDDPQSVAVDGDTGNVYVSDRDNRRVNAYDASGDFLFSVGRDVAEPDGGTAVEVCGAAEACRKGDAGSGPGEVGSTGEGESEEGALGIAVSQPDGNAATGTVFLADSQNRRVNTYALDGSSPASFGSSAIFGAVQPRKIAVDSRGIVYASNSSGGAEVERYDTDNANGGGVGFLAPIPPSKDEVQTITFTSGVASGDAFTLTCPNGAETGVIKKGFQAAFFAEAIQKVLDSSCGAGNTKVFTPGPDPVSKAIIVFLGDYAATDVPATVCTTMLSEGTCSVTAESNGLSAALLPANNPQLPGHEATATSGLTVDPDSDGAGPDADALYVLRKPDEDNPVVQQIGPANAPGLSAAPGAAEDIHGAGAGFSFRVQGLGLDASSGNLYVTSAFPSRISVLNTLASIPTPSLTIDSVNVKTDTTATFSGAVDAKGALVSCKFQYSTDPDFAGSTDVAVPGCASLSVNAGFQPISQKAAGLIPNTHYFVRLAVSRPFIPGSTVTTLPKAFDTDAPPPAISEVGAVQVSDTSARMVGTIDPKNSATGYVFEYGKTPSLGSATVPLNIGGGHTPIVVSQVVGGLSPDADYYFRLVATNLAGTASSASKTLHTRADPPPPVNPGNCANETLRQEQSSTYLPDCRAYEMVSPPDKNQGGVASKPVGNLNAGFSRDGNSAGFCTTAVFGEPASQMTFTCAPYISRRNPSGWSTVSALPPYCQVDVDSGTTSSGGVFLSPNFDLAAILLPESESCQITPLDPAAPLGSRHFYREDFTTDPPSFNLITPEPLEGQSSRFEGSDDDFSHILYSSTANQTPDTSSTALKLYDYHDGALTLVSRDTNGNPFGAASALPTNEPAHLQALGPLPGAVSDDGRRIYFQNQYEGGTGGCQSAACHLYMREGDATTYEVSASECTASCGSDTSGETMRGATPAGGIAFFSSADKLTDGAAPTGQKLYRWDENGAPGHKLLDVTPDNEPADGAAPSFGELLGISDDGNTAYFVNSGQLVAGEPVGRLFEPKGSLTGEEKLYRWSWNGGSPTLTYLGPFDERFTDGFYSTLAAMPNVSQYWTQVTPDGRYLAVMTELAYDPVADKDEDADIYRWDEEGGWTCVSCQQPGVPSAGSVNTVRVLLDPNFNTIQKADPVAAISDDGKRIFFDTPDALVPEDTNVCTGGEGNFPNNYPCKDVYEWNDGTVSLVSSGAGSEASFLVGATHSGDSVFFETRDRLVGRDTDNGIDVYVARTDGGFPEPAPQPPICEGEACRSAGTAAPAGAGAGTAVFEGPGNPQPKHKKPRNHHKRHHKRGHRRAANHNRRAYR
jgi:hypothetical protein